MSAVCPSHIVYLLLFDNLFVCSAATMLLDAHSANERLLCKSGYRLKGPTRRMARGRPSGTLIAASLATLPMVIQVRVLSLSLATTLSISCCAPCCLHRNKPPGSPAAEMLHPGSAVAHFKSFRPLCALCLPQRLSIHVKLPKRQQCREP